VRREEKAVNLEELKAEFEKSSAVLLTHYRGMTVKQSNALRRSLDSAGAHYRVAKNTLASLAASQTGNGALSDELVGPTGFVFVHEDPAAAAKALCTFAKTCDKLVIRGGVLGGKLLSAADVEALSQLPSREQMLSMFVGVLQAPMRDFVGVLAAVPRGLVQVLSAIEEKKKAA
jgi:large subunit ribosomal protein L10